MENAGSKAATTRARRRHQAALDLREVLKTPAGKRAFARQLHRAGTYVDAPTELARGRRLNGLDLERDILRVAGDAVLAELRHIIFAEFTGDDSPEVVPDGVESLP